MTKTYSLRIGILGGGPAALFMYKRLVESGLSAAVSILKRMTASGMACLTAMMARPMTM